MVTTDVILFYGFTAINEDGGRVTEAFVRRDDTRYPSGLDWLTKKLQYQLNVGVRSFAGTPRYYVYSNRVITDMWEAVKVDKFPVVSPSDQKKLEKATKLFDIPVKEIGWYLAGYSDF